MAKTDKFRSDLKNARGNGSAHAGAHHWQAQRISAVAMLGLTIWLIYFISQVVRVDGYYNLVMALFDRPINVLGAIIFITTALYHGTIGIQVVFEDYIHHRGLRTVKIIGTRFLAIILGAASILSILKIYFN